MITNKKEEAMEKTWGSKLIAYSVGVNFSHFGLKYDDQKQYAESFGENPETFKVEPRKQAIVDGYHVGNSLLEGIKFIVEVCDDGSLSVQSPKVSEDYMNTLNEKLWLERIIEHAIKHEDMFTGMDGTEDINLIMTDGKYNFE